MKKISIIIRSRNEEKWITSCLDAIFSQSIQDIEVVLVDNKSTDRTIEKAKAFDVNVIRYEADVFKPGYAINLGVQASTGEYFVVISAHCIPVDQYWLENLVRNFTSPETAGVYGRQEPLSFTSDLDKRDLINIFGLDKKYQKKDPFFHNANSMVKRVVWDEFPFDEGADHIEDRIWAQKILKNGYQIIYEPEASVYHYHGINQGRNVTRAKGIVRILEQIHNQKYSCVLEGLNIVAIIPSRGAPRKINGRYLIEKTIANAKKSKLLNKIVIASDNNETIDIADKLNTTAILRPKDLSFPYISLVQVYKYVLDQLADKNYYPDLIFLLEEEFPFRSDKLIDRMIEGLLHGGYDSVIAAYREYGSLWRPEGDELIRVDEGMVPSKLKTPLYRGIMGLGCLTHPEAIYGGKKLGKKVGLIDVDNDIEKFCIESTLKLKIAEYIETKCS